MICVRASSVPFVLFGVWLLVFVLFVVLFVVGLRVVPLFV